VSAPQQNQPIQCVEAPNPVFQKDSVTIGEVESPYQTYSAPSVTKPESAEVFDIGRYYTIAEEEVIPKIREVRHIVNNADLSGKTDVEKYGWIEDQFADAFGSDFMMAKNLSLPSTMYYMIGIEFSDTLNRLIEDPAQVNRTRLYGDKSTEEIQNTIREKYPDTLANRDLFLMVNEMRNTGVLDADSLRSLGTEATNGIIDTLTLLRSYAKLSTQNSNDEIGSLTLEERDKRWMSMLDKPVNIDNLLRLYNSWSQDNRFSMGADTASFLTNFLGGVKGSDGLFEVNNNGNSQGEVNSNNGPVYINFIGGAGGGGGLIQIDYNPSRNAGVDTNGSHNEEDWSKMLSMMLKGMDEYEDLIRSRMQLIDSEEYNPVTGENPEAEENPVVVESPEAGEHPEIEETPGAEENLETEEADESNDSEEADTGSNEEAA